MRRASTASRADTLAAIALVPDALCDVQQDVLDEALGWAEYVLARERPDDSGVAAVRDLLRSLGLRPASRGR